MNTDIFGFAVVGGVQLATLYGALCWIPLGLGVTGFSLLSYKQFMNAWPSRELALRTLKANLLVFWAGACVLSIGALYYFLITTRVRLLP